MKTRRMTALLLAVLCCGSMLSAGAALADPVVTPAIVAMGSGGIAPFWVNVNTLTCTLTLSGTTAECYAKIVGLSSTSKINGTLTLYRQEGSAWKYADSWSNSSDSSTLTITIETTVTRGYNYKLVIEASVYRDGVWESVEKESAVRYCG